MAVGPVDVYIIGFPGNKFTGRIAPAIMELVDNGTIACSICSSCRRTRTAS